MADAWSTVAHCIHGNVWSECPECPQSPVLTCQWHGVGLVEGDRGWSCPLCPRPSTVERLRAEVEALQALYEQRRDLLRSCDAEVRRLRADLAAATPKEDAGV